MAVLPLNTFKYIIIVAELEFKLSEAFYRFSELAYCLTHCWTYPDSLISYCKTSDALGLSKHYEYFLNGQHFGFVSVKEPPELQGLNRVIPYDIKEGLDILNVDYMIHYSEYG